MKPHGELSNIVSKCMQPHGAKELTENITGAIWTPFK